MAYLADHSRWPIRSKQTFIRFKRLTFSRSDRGRRTVAVKSSFAHPWGFIFHKHEGRVRGENCRLLPRKAHCFGWRFFQPRGRRTFVSSLLLGEVVSTHIALLVSYPFIRTIPLDDSTRAEGLHSRSKIPVASP